MANASKSLQKLGTSVAGLIIILVILVAFNALIRTTRMRSDLTAERLYTLSDGSRQIIKDLNQPVTLKLFFNFSMAEIPPYLKEYARQVQDLLAEYATASKGTITVEVHDPKPDSDTEDWARKYGVPGQQMGMMGPSIYFGLVAVAGTQEAALPVIDPRANSLLEYNITRLIHRVLNPGKPVVGILSSLQVLGPPRNPFTRPGPDSKDAWLAFRELQQDYVLRELTPDVDRIDPDIRALVLVHPKNLTDTTLFAIDQFVLRGGHVLAFLDPLSVAEIESATDPNAMMMGPSSSSLGKLLDAWGVTFQPERVVADLAAATPVRGPNNEVEESPVWLSLTRAHINTEDILTAQLDSMNLPFAGSFQGNTTEQLTFTPLIQSSANAGTVSTMAARMGGSAIRREWREVGVTLPLAVRLSGTFQTAFPGGAPKPADTNSPAPAIAETLKEGRSTVILAGDVDMLYNRFCVQELEFFGQTAVQPINDNMIFLANAVEQVAGSEYLIGIRSRGQFARPFDRVIAIEQNARRDWQARENELQGRLEDTQRRLSEMQNRKDANQKFILSPEQKAAIEQFQQQEGRIKQELKQVRKNLRAEIDRLGRWVKILNIALLPALVSLAGVTYGITRRTRK
ncbi:MAG: hypothetical protein A2498_03400 [Lentisphaerae bacterium RIFOXYC12_FULL_60_16]|nr:MAG: hypothetical protein A2498_03400 [Lentisphaerae bacterium RIFOXYC12_FULL_60_16]